MPSPISLADAPDLVPAVERLALDTWPQFVLHGGLENWNAVYERFGRFQVAFRASDSADGPVVAAGHTVPIIWDGTNDGLPRTLRGTLLRAIEVSDGNRPANTLVALSALVAKDQRGNRLGGAIIEAMRSLAATHALDALIAPVRPTWKSFYPLYKMEQYLRFRRPDGLPFDPWIRLHERLGGKVLKIADKAFTVTGSVDDWESWTGMSFPHSGRFVVPGALVPVVIDRDKGTGTYEEPNVWMKHPVSRDSSR